MNFKKTKTPIVTLLLTIALSACGGAVRSELGSTDQNSLPGGSGSVPTDPGGGDTGGGLSPASYSLNNIKGVAVGAKWTSPGFSSDSTFKVKITAGSGTINFTGTSGGADKQVGCYQYRVTVNGQSHTVTLKSPNVSDGTAYQVTGYGNYLGSPWANTCADYPTEAVFDFSSTLGAGGGSNIKVVVDQFRTNYQCNINYIVNFYPSGFTNLAGSDRCAYRSLRYGTIVDTLPNAATIHIQTDAHTPL